jgi:alanyl-tRNA synthetase
MPPVSTTPPSSDTVRGLFIDFFKSKPAPGERRGHAFIPSSPVIPHEDPTLLFTNAGMNQFKPIFLGQVDPQSPMGKLKRAANTQKCIRAGGKHNDLEDVGKDTYHHTFFEMLGNWSFGDYFKAEAIEWAWEFLTRVCGIDGERLYATYFGGDEAAGLAPDTEARDLWKRYLPESRIIPGTMKDNFWEMGDTGPCGPSSEIHYDRVGNRDAASIVNTGDPDVLEIWNLVFIQFNREGPTSLKPLPAKHVDTGMGFERLVSVLQDKRSNYDTDVFAPYFDAIQKVTRARAYQGRLGTADEGNIDTAYRVIADHIRTLTFAITDGAVPSNEGRGYVLRRILRRAVRYGRQMLDAKPGFFSELVPVVVEKMGHAFPELTKDPQRVMTILREEEESFGRTLDRGIKLLHSHMWITLSQLFGELRPTDAKGEVPHLHMPGTAQWSHSAPEDFQKEGVLYIPPDAVVEVLHSNGNQIATYRFPAEVSKLVHEWLRQRPMLGGSTAFRLYDTYGFPIDLSVLMAEEAGFDVDTAEYERLMEEARERSRGGGGGGRAEAGRDLALGADAIESLRQMGGRGITASDDAFKFEGKDIIATVRAIWNGDNFDENIRADMGKADRLGQVGVILDKTNFYAEMGGQVTDAGRLHVTREARSSVRDAKDGGEFKVEHVRAFGGYILHIGRVTRGEIRVGDSVQCTVESQRRTSIAANHTATHLLNFALRKVLGDHVDQKGSLVAPDRLRFDFTNPGPVSGEQLGKVEEIVRGQIRTSLPVFAASAPLATARSIMGLRAVFGEAYPDPVRVVSIGRPLEDLLARPEDPAWAEYSVEFCGGTHLGSTAEAQEFAIVTEEAVAKGVRRVVALSGVPARAAIVAADTLEQRLDAAAHLDVQALPAELHDIARQIDELTLPVARKDDLRKNVAILQERVKAAQKELAGVRRQQAAGLAREIADASPTGLVIVARIALGADRVALEQAVKTVRDRRPDAAVMLLSPPAPEEAESPKVSIVAAVPEPLVKRGLRAGDWVREVAAILGGKGGGRPDAAQGAGPDIARLPDAVATAQAWADQRAGQ